MVIGEIENSRLINEEHRKLNGNLREENRLLIETVNEMYEVLRGTSAYDELPFEKWETILQISGSDKPIQLRLF